MRRIRVPRLGFSLIELMVAIAVVMGLVALALPRYRLFIATSRQAEAQANLGIIASLQQSYHLEHNVYHSGLAMGGGHTDKDCSNSTPGDGQQNYLGFRVTKCSKLRYTYKSSRGDDTAQNDGTVDTQLIYPKCRGSGKNDNWKIDKGREMTHFANVIKECED